MRFRVKIGHSGKLIVVADACHSGSSTRGLHNEDEEDFVRGTNDKFIIPGKIPNIINKDEPVSWLFVGACKSYQNNYEHRASDGIYYGSLSYVISNSSLDYSYSSFSTVIRDWKSAMSSITRYPQDIVDEGRPNKKSHTLF